MSAPPGAPSTARPRGTSPGGRGRGGRRGSSTNNTGGRGRGRGSTTANAAAQSLHKAVVTNNAINTAQNGRGRGRGSHPRGTAISSRGAATPNRGLPNKSVRFSPPRATAPNPFRAAAASAKDFMNEATARYQVLKPKREEERSRAIRDGVLADPEKKTSLEDAITPVGTCTEMCPEYERVERIVQNMVDKSEKVHNEETGRDLPSHDKMVKRFRRSAAGNDEQLPSDIRTPATLKATLDYLLDSVIGDPRQLGSVHKFVWDRTRAIRNDFSIQQVTRPEDVRLAVDCFERIARFHILSLHQLSNPDNLVGEEFNAHQDREQLNNTLLSLMYYYDDNRQKQSFPNEAEFRAYCILFEVQSQQPDLEDRLQSWPEDVLQDGRVATAFKLYMAAGSFLFEQGPLRPLAPAPLAQSNAGAFWTVLKSPAVSYLMACVAEISFAQIRFTTLQGLWASTRSASGSVQSRTEDWTPDELAKVMYFDTAEQAINFCTAFGLRFAANDQNTQYLDLTLGLATLDKSSIPTRQVFSHNAVEAKRYNRTLMAVINGTSAASAIRQGLVDSDNDQHVVEDSQPTEHESTLFFPESQTQTSGAPVVGVSGFNPGAASFTPGTGQSPFQTQGSPFGTPSTAATPTSSASSNFGKPSGLLTFPNLLTSAAPSIQPFILPTSLGTPTTDPFATKPSPGPRPVGQPTSQSFTNPFAPATSLSWSTMVASASGQDRNKPDPSLSQPPGKLGDALHFVRHSPDPAPSAPSDHLGDPAPQAPTSFETPLFRLTQPTPSIDSPTAASLFSRPLPSSTSAPVVDFSTPPPKAPPSPRPHKIDLSRAAQPLFPDAAPPRPLFPPSLIPATSALSYGQDVSRDPDVSGLRREGAAPTVNATAPSSCPSVPNTEEQCEKPPLEIIPFIVKPEPIKREAAIDLVTHLSLLQPGGLMQQFVDHILPRVIKPALAQFELAKEFDAIKSARHIILSKKYFHRWRKITWHNILTRRAQKRRRAFTETMRSAEMKRVKGQSDLAAILLAQKEKEWIQAEQRQAELDKIKAATEVTKARMASMPNPEQIAGRKRKSVHAELPEDKVETPRKILKGHQRSRTVDNTTHRAKPLVNLSIERMGRATSVSPFRGSIFAGRSVLAATTSNSSPPRKLDTTRTDYFRLKALGIDPDTPLVPDTEKDLERRRRQQALDAASLRASSGLRTSRIVNTGILAEQETRKPAEGIRQPEAVKVYDADNDDLLQELKKIREVMGEQTEWFRTQGQLIEKEVEREELRQSMSSQGSPQASVDDVIKVNGYDVRPAPAMPGRSLSRAEQRIRRTGAHGLATKPIGGTSGYLPVAMSQRTASRLAENNKQVQTNGGKGKQREQPAYEAHHEPYYDTGPDERFDNVPSPQTPRHLKPAPTNGTNTNTGQTSLQKAQLYQLANGSPIAKPENDLEEEEEVLLDEDDPDAHQQHVYDDDADEEYEEEYEEDEDGQGEEQDYYYENGEAGEETDISNHPYLQLPRKSDEGEEYEEDAPTPYGGSQVSHATSGAGTADDALVLSD